MYIYIKNRTAGLISMFLIALAGMITTFVITVNGDLGIGVQGANPNYGDLIYTKPWSRIHVYMLGAWWAILYFEYMN
jgi:hypothetical protein